MNNRLCILFLLIVLNANFLNAFTLKKDLNVKSPNATVDLTFSENQGVIKYKLHWNKELIVDSSVISILPDVPISIVKSKTATVNTSWNPVWGQFSKIQDNYNELTLYVELKNGMKGKLIARVYNQGIGFRFELNEFKEGDIATLYCEYNLAGEDNLFCPAGEGVPLGPLKIDQLKGEDYKSPKIAFPVVIEKASKNFLSILESDLYAANGFDLMRLNFDKKNGLLSTSNKVTLKGNKMLTPWRVILLGNNAGDLVTNTVPDNLATPSQLTDTAWIKPGKTMWDWRVHGYTAPDGFVYGINTESYKRFIDFAAEKKIEYFLIDDSWYTSVSKGSFELSKKLNLKEVTDYAAAKGVGLILYYDRQHGEYGDDELYPYYQSLGMKGIKYGFMKENVDFTREAIKQSAASKLLIDFHDAPVPFTGITRTYPNAVSREFCHAQQDSRRAFTPETFIKMALINAIQGPLDMNNGNFDLTGINSGKREKGPKILNSYLSTVTSEVARTLVIFSGLVCIPDAPEAYNAKADLFEFIQKMPVGKWDETKILNSSMGENITTARRHGKEWFIGSVIDQKGGTLDIKLDFLEEGQNYDVTFYEDTSETNCKTNPEAYQIRKGTVKKGQLVQAKLAPGGGHCMWIRPKLK